MILTNSVPGLKLLDRVYEVAKYEFQDLKYLYKHHVVGLVGTILSEAHVPKVNPIPRPIIDRIIDAMHDTMYGGIEPEFDSPEAYQNYLDGIEQFYRVCYFPIAAVIPSGNPTMTDYRRAIKVRSRSPYRDKTIPFLVSNSEFYLYEDLINKDIVDENYNIIQSFN